MWSTTSKGPTIPDDGAFRIEQAATDTLGAVMERNSKRGGGGVAPVPSPEGEVPAVSRQPAPELGPRAQRTIARIVEATREVFLTKGYSGTTIDEIAKAASVSRASFYTYFPSKRDVLLAVGERSARESLVAIDRLKNFGATRNGLAAWVREYMAFLDINGSFAFAWTQAAHEDDSIRAAGMRRHLVLCRRFGEELAATAGRSRTDTVELGLVMFSALERTWAYCQLYEDTVDRSAIERELAHALWSAARQQLPAMNKRA